MEKCNHPKLWMVFAIFIWTCTLTGKFELQHFLAELIGRFPANFAQTVEGIFSLVQQELCSAVNRNSSVSPKSDDMESKSTMNVPMQRPGDYFGESGVDQYAKPLTTVQPSLDIDGFDRNSSDIFHDEALDDEEPKERVQQLGVRSSDRVLMGQGRPGPYKSVQ